MSAHTEKIVTAKQFVGTLGRGAVSCRMVGHNWVLSDAVSGGTGERVLLFACGVCPTTRRDHIHTRTGELVWRQYTYAPGYRKPKAVVGRVNIRDVRVEFIRRINNGTV